MPTAVIIGTNDVGLSDAWERQIPPGCVALRLDGQRLPDIAPGFAAVVILDAACEAIIPTVLLRCPTIFIGEPQSHPFEQARLAKRAKVFLSYQDSTTRLGEFLPLLDDIAQKQSMVELLNDKGRRNDTPRSVHRSTLSETAEFWDFLEGAVESLETRERLLAEFRRASRHVLRASHSVFFLREADGFRADRGTSFFPSDDPLVCFFERHPAVIDGSIWDGPSDPVGELAVRNRLALWGARLLVPIHDNGRLLGLIALGVRDDGQVYDEADKNKAVFLARFLRTLLSRCAHLSRLSHIANQVALGAKYLPGSIVLGRDEDAPRHVPVVVRELIGRSRRTHEVYRISPSLEQPFRARAGIVAETGGVWAFWEEASGEVVDNVSRDKGLRLAMLRELALTLNHEIGNALVSLTIFRQSTPERPLPSSLLDTVKSDVSQLEILNSNLTVLQGLQEAQAASTDVREVARKASESIGVRVDLPMEAIILRVNGTLLEFALRSLLRAVVEKRQDTADELVMKVRSTGADEDLTALFAVKGRYLELDGILPEPSHDSIPNQGRIGVFIAKEILRLHHGDIHAGPGIEGTEILFSVRNW